MTFSGIDRLNERPTGGKEQGSERTWGARESESE